jgi:imidazolonepropionase-like amidohydrolase
VVALFAAEKLPFVLQSAEGILDDEKVVGPDHPGVIVEPDGVREEAGVIKNLAADFTDLGLPVAFGSAACGAAQWLPLHVAYAVRYGMSPQDALLALTRNPARLFELDDRIGSLRRGKDADFVVFSGDPFEPTSRVLLVVVNGEVAVDQREIGR